MEYGREIESVETKAQRIKDNILDPGPMDETAADKEVLYELLGIFEIGVRVLIDIAESLYLIREKD